MHNVENLTQETFELALEEPGLMVVDFWASWCGPCRTMAPQFERAAGLRPAYRFAKVDVDAEPGLASRYDVGSIPTLLVLRDGEPVAAHAGVIGAEQLAQALDRIAAATPATGAPVASKAA
jgi:thioredoxin